MAQHNGPSFLFSSTLLEQSSEDTLSSLPFLFIKILMHRPSHSVLFLFCFRALCLISSIHLLSGVVIVMHC